MTEKFHYICTSLNEYGSILANMRTRTTLLIAAMCAACQMQGEELVLKVKNQYLNIPVSHQTDRKRLTFAAKGADTLNVVVRIAEGKPDYWVFKDISRYKGKTLTLNYEGNGHALEKVVAADTIFGQANMYKEKNRPQFHFTTRRGWINDPNGLIFHNGIYHLYYQHNPYERDWENMTWGHATSTDLLHWTEHDDVLFPDRIGTMFSGSAVYDDNNTSGFGTEKNPPLVYAYTADHSDRQTQCIAYSLDGGYTLHKYKENPVIDSHDKWQSHDTRDPRLFWYAPGKHWVMVLNERDGHSIYTSANLKDWEFQSHIVGFWECPDLFELPVDGNRDNKRWVMYGASNTYMIGQFDGKTFTPESGKHFFSAGSIYAAQTFNGIPDSDGRRIQLGWGRIGHPGMPFNGMMLLPTELQLRTTKDGIRLVSKPIKEVENLLTNVYSAADEQKAEDLNARCRSFADLDGMHIRCTIHLSHCTSAGISLNGQKILDYDTNGNTVNGRFYSPQNYTRLSLTADIYVDRTSIEAFIDDGLYSYSMERRLGDNHDGLNFWGNNITVSDVQIDAVKSIW